LPTIPDALALLDPKDALREVVAFTKRMNEWVQQMNAVQRRDQMITYYPPNYALLGITPDPRRIPPPPPTPDSDYSKVKCFRKPDLEDDVREAEQALLWFLPKRIFSDLGVSFIGFGLGARFFAGAELCQGAPK
jgi:hypothetical protein